MYVNIYVYKLYINPNALALRAGDPAGQDAVDADIDRGRRVRFLMSEVQGLLEIKDTHRPRDLQ